MAGSNEIIGTINKLKHHPRFSRVVFTRDWHPQDHCSFADNNPGSKLFETIKLTDTQVDQVMWPVHCVQG